jgi:hypothetical protein
MPEETLTDELVNPNPFAVDGYDFFPGIDSPGYDIANVGRNVPEAARAASKIQGAIAFNTNGDVKAKIRPAREWKLIEGDASREGLYIRKRHRLMDVVRRLVTPARRSS